MAHVGGGSVARLALAGAAIWALTTAALGASAKGNDEWVDPAPHTYGFSGNAVWTPPHKPERLVMRTDDNQEIIPAVLGKDHSQGWWNEAGTNTPSNDNYSTGGGGGGSERRGFFTFDVGAVTTRVVGAKLKAHSGVCVRTAEETLGLFDVSTLPRVLNRLTGVRPDIVEDLGTGDSYGLFSVITDGDRRWLRFPLNREALKDLNRTQRYFSVGARLMSLGREEPFGKEVFGCTGNRAARLVLNVAPDRPVASTTAGAQLRVSAGLRLPDQLHSGAGDARAD